MPHDLSSVTPVAEMAGEDAEETGLLRAALGDARGYLASWKWCRGIEEAYFGAGVGGVACAFLFRIDAAPGVDEWLWVVVGDAPAAYLVTDDIADGVDALAAYCDLMEEWVRAVRGNGNLEDVFPVKARPTPGNADDLEKRLALLRDDVIPSLAPRLVPKARQ